MERRISMEKKLHTALKNLSEQVYELKGPLGDNVMELFANDTAPMDDALQILAEYEAREGCMPDYAVRVNDDSSLELGTQLFTKMPYSCGNGMIFRMGNYEGRPTYRVVTDIGTEMGWMFETELLHFFEIGDYIMDVEEGYKTRTGNDYVQG